MMTALTGDERFTGIEVREFRGVGFSVVTLWQGKIMDRLRLFHLPGAANEWAERLHRETDDGSLDMFANKPTLKLWEGGDAKP